VGDVGERPAVHKGRSALQRLQQVRLYGVAQEHRHGARHPEVLGGHGPPVVGAGEDDPAKSHPQVLQVGGQREDRHDLRGDRDLPLRLPRIPVLVSAQPDHRMPDRPVGDVHHPRPQDREGIDAERVAVGDRVVQEGRGQVVRGPDGVVVAGQVEVEVLHRDHLAPAAAGRAALDAEHGSQGWLADADRGPVADPVESLRQPHRGRGLALAEGRGGDRGDDHVPAPAPGRHRLALQPLDALEADLRLDRPVQLHLVVVQAEFAGNLEDGARCDGAGDLEAGRHHRGYPPVRDVGWAPRDAPRSPRGTSRPPRGTLRPVTGSPARPRRRSAGPGRSRRPTAGG
jgi:hypothetical protein